MTEQRQIYKCAKCGNIIEVLHVGAGELVCCGEPMEIQKANIVDASSEKHVPVIEKTEKGVRVKVGSMPHPMEESHFIEWIEVIEDGPPAGEAGKSYRTFLRPGDVPEAEFCIEAENITAREYCNLHGLWKS